MSKEQRTGKRNWAFAVTAIALVLLCLGLAVWQWERAEEKLRLQERVRQQGVKPLSAVDLSQPGSAYQPLRIEGRLLTGSDFLLDNRVRHGVAGYEWFTPLVVTGTQEVLMVNRGWLAQGPDRSRLPALPSRTASRVSLEGRLHPLPSGPVLKSTEWRPGWPKRVQALEVSRLEGVLGRAVARYQFRPDKALDPGLEVGWAVTVVSPARHRGYALQWLLLAVAGLWLTGRVLHRGGHPG